MVNLARVIAQVGFVGVKIIGRAFVESYKIAAAESAKNAIGASAASLSGDALSRKTGMTFTEAKQILNIDTDDLTAEQLTKEIETRYTHLYNTNEPANGGSFYIQSKIVRARERVEMELTKESEKKPEV